MSDDNSFSIAFKLADLKPSAGVIDAYIEIERQILRYLAVLDIKPKGSAAFAFIRDTDAPQYLKRLVRELSQLRNAAAHGRGDISKESAQAYISSARRVGVELNNLVVDAERSQER